MTATARKSALEANVPQSGRYADACAVAATALVLRGHAKPEDGWLAPARHAVTLHAISAKLHRIAERECSEDQTCPVCGGTGDARVSRVAGLTGKPCRACAGHGTTAGKRLERLRRDASEIAGHYGCRAYFQTDPRGCSLYLIPAEIVPQSWAAVPGDPLEACVYGREAKSPPPLATLQARWIEANYNRGHAVVRLGR